MTEETQVKGKGLAIAGMVVGIVAAILSIFTIGVLFGVVALILSAIGLYQLMNSNGPKGMAIAGIVLGVFAIAFSYYQLSRVTTALEDAGLNIEDMMDGNLDELKEQMEQLQEDANIDLEEAMEAMEEELEGN